MKIREEIVKASPDDPLYQFAKEILAMIVAPHRYDTDPVHGPTLEEQQRLAQDMYRKVKSKPNKMYSMFLKHKRV